MNKADLFLFKGTGTKNNFLFKDTGIKNSFLFKDTGTKSINMNGNLICSPVIFSIVSSSFFIFVKIFSTT